MSTTPDTDRILDELRRVVDEAESLLRQASRGADDHVHRHPWQAVGIAAGIGLLVGILVSRR